MPNDKKLSNLQINILDILWENGSLSVQEIKRLLEPQRQLAQTSIATILTRLEKQGFVKYNKQGRKYIYSANIAKYEVQDNSIDSLLKNLFKGSKASLVSHLLAEELTVVELEHIQNLIKERSHSNA